MLRSEVNNYVKDALEFFESYQFKLPYFSKLKPEDLKNMNMNIYNITNYSLGWDLTDFGSGNFEEVGLLLFTLRNGRHDESNSKRYAEKIMMVRENQITPLHFHWKKKEDIINRGGGNLVIKVFKSNEKEELSESDFTVISDGRVIDCEPGHEVVLHPGESITLEPFIYHSFWGEKGSGHVMVGEVSETSDDNQDNRFYENQPRFPEIMEDEEKMFVLVNEY